MVTRTYAFSGPEGDTSHGPLVYGDDGFLYGVTYQGGQYGYEGGRPGNGVIFRVASDGSGFVLGSAIAAKVKIIDND